MTDDGLRWISGLKNLRELNLYGDRITDAGLVRLKNLANLEELNLLGAAVTDDGLDALSGMTHLRDLNLYRTQVTNAGLAKLKAMRQLADLDLRYTRVTQGGIDTLRAGMPKLHVEFIATQAARAGATGAPAMSGKGEKALAAWVEAMGGHAKFAQDRLTAISLANTSVTDQQLVNLREAPALQTLSLETTQNRRSGLQTIRSARRSDGVKPQSNNHVGHRACSACRPQKSEQIEPGSHAGARDRVSPHCAT